MTNAEPRATFTLAVSAVPNSGGTVTGAGTYVSSTSVTVTATANTAGGYAFVSWTQGGNQVSTSTTYTLIVTANTTMQANFRLLSTDTDSCDTCGYSRFAGQYLHCCYSPPAFVHDDGTGFWPIVLPTSWCGNFKAPT